MKKLNSNNAGLLIAIIFLAAMTPGCRIKETKPKSPSTDSLMSVKDSVVKPPVLPAGDEPDEGEGGPYFPENVVITASVPGKPGTGFSGLKFGDRVYKDEEQSDEQTAVFYLQDPVKMKGIKSYSADADYFINSSEYEEYQKYFSLPPFAALKPGVKKVILDNDYDSGNSYMTSQNEERARSVVAYADYDADGIKDVAVVLDNNQKQISRLLIICTNKATKKPYVAFAENYSDKVKINSFKAGARVYMSSTDLVPAPVDGVIIEGEDVKLSIMYDRQLQKFKSYFQEAVAAGNDDE